jgi:energy-converting hydrogenase Eha subunit C
METDCVFFEVKTTFSNIILMSLASKGYIMIHVALGKEDRSMIRKTLEPTTWLMLCNTNDMMRQRVINLITYLVQKHMWREVELC